MRHWGKIVGVLAVLAVAGAAYAYWHYTTLHPSTDDAYVEANTVQISPSVSGEVGEVDVKSFDTVKAGDVLLKISQPQLEAQLKAAEAGLQAAQAKKTNVEAAQAAVAQARAALDTATIKSPVDGTVGKISIQPGTMARAGVPIFAIVDGSKWWVDANFKETDLARIHPGQKATVSVDIYPDQRILRGRRSGKPNEHVGLLAASCAERDGKLDQADAALSGARFPFIEAR